jgi:creatinine amidohydrolase
MTLYRWEQLTRDEVTEIAPSAVFVLPVASIEQHGPHLPTVTDTALLEAVVERACASAAPEVEILLAPMLCFGASDHHLPFGGTLSLSTETLRAVLTDLVRSAAEAGCRRILLLNGHGGNASTCLVVASDLARQTGALVAAASYWDLVDPPEGLSGRFPGHAGEFETSLMLVVRPELVRLDRARPSPGVLPVSPKGVHASPPDLWQRIDGFSDDPRAADAALGQTVLDRQAQALAAAIVGLGAA